MEGQSSPQDRGVERRLESLKAEVDALQVEVMGGKAPWYRQVSVVVPMAVAVAAFVFSLVTTVIAERRIDRENEHETRQP